MPITPETFNAVEQAVARMKQEGKWSPTLETEYEATRSHVFNTRPDLIVQQATGVPTQMGIDSDAMASVQAARAGRAEQGRRFDVDPAARARVFEQQGVDLSQFQAPQALLDPQFDPQIQQEALLDVFEKEVEAERETMKSILPFSSPTGERILSDAAEQITRGGFGPAISRALGTYEVDPQQEVFRQAARAEALKREAEASGLPPSLVNLVGDTTKFAVSFGQSGGQAPALIGMHALQAAHEGKTQAEAQGWDEAEANTYAGVKAIIEGGTTALMGKLGMQGAEQSVLKQMALNPQTFKQAVGQGIRHEVYEEVLIAELETLHDKWAGMAELPTPEQMAEEIGRVAMSAAVLGGGMSGGLNLEQARQRTAAPLGLDTARFDRIMDTPLGRQASPATTALEQQLVTGAVPLPQAADAATPTERQLTGQPQIAEVPQPDFVSDDGTQATFSTQDKPAEQARLEAEAYANELRREFGDEGVAVMPPRAGQQGFNVVIEPGIKPAQGVIDAAERGEVSRTQKRRYVREARKLGHNISTFEAMTPTAMRDVLMARGEVEAERRRQADRRATPERRQQDIPVMEERRSEEDRRFGQIRRQAREALADLKEEAAEAEDIHRQFAEGTLGDPDAPLSARQAASLAADLDPDSADPEMRKATKAAFREELRKLQGGKGKFVKVEVPLIAIEPRADYQPEAVAEYAARDTPIPPAIGGFDAQGDFVLVDGNTRARAAKERGDTTITVYVPQETADAAGRGKMVTEPEAAVEPDTTPETEAPKPKSRVVRKMKESVKELPFVGVAGRWLSEDGSYGRPQEWVEGKRRIGQEATIAEERAMSWAKRFGKAVKAAGIDLTQEGKALEIKKTLEGRKPMTDWPAPIQDLLQEWRNLHDQFSAAYADALEANGLEARAKVVRDNIGKYVKSVPEWTLTATGRVSQAIRGFKRELQHTPSLTKFRRDKWTVTGRGRRVVAKFDTEAQAKEYVKENAKGKKWKIVEPRTQEDRDIEDVSDPRFLLVAGLGETAHDAQVVKLHKTVAETMAVKPPKDLEGAELAAWAEENGLAKLPGHGRFHALKRTYVPREVAEDLTELVDVPMGMQAFLNGYMRVWKVGKVVDNPATHGRNIMGNSFFFAPLAGISPFNPRNWKYYARGAKLLFDKGARWEEAVRADAITGDYYTGEIRRLKRFITDPVRQTPGGLLAAIRKVAGATQAGITKAYQLEDLIFKAAAYEKYRDQGMSAKDAGDKVNKWFPNYGRTSKLSRWLADKPIGMPFASFFDQSLRIMGRAAKERPIATLTIFAMPGILSFLSKMMAGVSDEEDAILRANQSYVEAYFMPYMPWRDSQGKPLTFDARYVVPLANDVLPQVREHGALYMPWFANGPLATTFVEQMSGRSQFTGKEFDGVGGRAEAAAGNLLPLPSLIQHGPKRVTKSMSADPTTEDTAYAVMGVVTGINLRRPYSARTAVLEAAAAAMEDGDTDLAVAIKNLWNNEYRAKYITKKGEEKQVGTISMDQIRNQVKKGVE